MLDAEFTQFVLLFLYAVILLAPSVFALPSLVDIWTWISRN